MFSLRQGLRFAVLVSLFLPVAQVSAAVAQQARAEVRCESNGSYRRCPASGSWRGARLVQQLSKTPCLEGRNWGFDHKCHLGERWLSRRLRRRQSVRQRG
jgi:hypothetical protein